MITNRHPLGIAAASLVLGAAGLGLSAIPGPASASPPDSIIVLAYPSDSALKAAQVGDYIGLAQVDATTKVLADGNVSVTIDPDDVPEDAFSNGDTASFQVQRTSASGAVGLIDYSLQVDPVDDELWVDPGADPVVTTARERARVKGFRTKTLSIPLHRVPSTKGKRLGVDDSSDPGGQVDTTKLEDYIGDATYNAPISPRAAPGGGAATCQLEGHWRDWVTVATSYPASGERAWLQYNSSEDTVTGTAASLAWGGKLHAEGTKSTDDSWGEDFARSGYNRSYMVETDFGDYKCVNVLSGFSWEEVAPRYQTGGTAYYKKAVADRPDWNDPDQCSNIANGTWYRGSVRGSDYKLSYGAAVKDVLGFDLSSQHAYTTSGRLAYEVDDGNKKICGSDDVPSKATKTIERFR